MKNLRHSIPMILVAAALAGCGPEQHMTLLPVDLVAENEGLILDFLGENQIPFHVEGKQRILVPWKNRQDIRKGLEGVMEKTSLVHVEQSRARRQSRLILELPPGNEVSEENIDAVRSVLSSSFGLRPEEITCFGQVKELAGDISEWR